MYLISETHPTSIWSQQSHRPFIIETYGRHMAQAVYFVAHQITQPFEVLRSTMPPSMATHSEEYAALETKRERQQQNWQCSILHNFCYKGVLGTVKTVGIGPCWWNSRATNERLAIWAMLWDDCALNLALTMYSCLAETVNFRAIYSHSSEEALRWQRFMKHVFCEICDSGYVHWVAPGAAAVISEAVKAT